MNLLPLQLDQAVKNELNSDETLKWLGQPTSYERMITASGWLIGIPFTLLGVFLLYKAIIGNEAPVAIFIIGIGICVLSFSLWRFLKKKKTVYVITNKRAFTLKLWINIQINNYYPESTGIIEKTVRPDGSGDLILAREHCTNGKSKSMKNYGFFTVKNVNEVEFIIKNTFKQHSASH